MGRVEPLTVARSKRDKALEHCAHLVVRHGLICLEESLVLLFCSVGDFVVALEKATRRALPDVVDLRSPCEQCILL